MADQNGNLPGEPESEPEPKPEPEPDVTVVLNRHRPAPIHGPALPPHLTDEKLSIEELAEDLQKSPFFMTSTKNNEFKKPSPEYEAIMALRNEGTRFEKADRAREDGNEEARAGQWKMAREHYEMGISFLEGNRQPEDPSSPDEDKKEAHVKELLLVNCAQCNLKLANYRMCIRDCEAALKINPKNIKACFRMASALISLNKLDEAEEACKLGLTFTTEKSHFELLLKRIINKRATKSELKKYEQEMVVVRQLEKEFLDSILSQRGVKRRETDAKPDLGKGKLKFIQNSLDSTNDLGIPMMVFYPIHEKVDLIEQFNETGNLEECMETVFPLPWDMKDQYTTETVAGFLETWEGNVIQWPEGLTLEYFLYGSENRQVEIVDDHLKMYLVPKKKIRAWRNTLPKDKTWKGPDVEDDTGETEDDNTDGESVGERDMKEVANVETESGEDDSDGNEADEKNPEEEDSEEEDAEEEESEEDSEEEDPEEEHSDEWDTEEEDG